MPDIDDIHQPAEIIQDGAMQPAHYKRLLHLAVYMAVGVALFLSAIKAAAWFMTDSVVILTSLVDSILDVIASVVNLVAVRQALVPADASHRFGHGKAEALAGLGQSLVIAISAFFLLYQSGQRFFHPQPVAEIDTGITVMIFSMVVTFGLLMFQRYVVRRTGSVAISADSLHYTSDFLVNAGVVAALVLVSQLGWELADPLFAAGIGLYILYTAWGIVDQSYHILLDRELPDEQRKKIRDLVMRHQAVKDMHDLRSRQSGSDIFIQVHIELDGFLTLNQVHEISDEVEMEIRKAYPGSEVLIHSDPEGLFEAHKGIFGD